MTDNTPETFCLRQLPLPTRVVLATFLFAIGLGYFSGLVQLHFAHAKKGELLPGSKEVVDVYFGQVGAPPMSQLERLISADQGNFNGSGTMKPAFFERSANWKKDTEKLKPDEKEKLLKEREGEQQALLAWIRKGVDKAAFGDESFALEFDKPFPVTAKYKEDKDGGKMAVNVKQILKDRCIRCHGDGAPDNKAMQFPLDDFDKFQKYATVKTTSAKSLESLALTTHVHLLGFGMMFLLTGVIFSLTSYPTSIRMLVAPMALIAQVIDIAFWWFGRLNPEFPKVIMVTGGIVAVSLLVQIVGSLFNMFDKKGKVFVLLLLLAAGGGGFWINNEYILPQLQAEKNAAAAQK